MNKLDEYVSKNVRIIVCVITALSSVYFLILLPLKELQDTTDTIKNNHLPHLKDSIEKIQATQEKQGILLEHVSTILER